MEFFNQRIDDSVLATADNIINNTFERITYTEAVKLLEKADKSFEFPVQWGIDLQSEHERYLAEELFQKPVIVIDYPTGIKAFYMRLNDGGKTVAAMDVLAPKVGEIIGGSQREERLDVLERRIQEAGLPIEDYWWYLDLRRFGTVPHAGFGLGFERLVQFMTGMGNIRDVIPFPRTPDSIEF
jgi:asparaginyl-tRNA synthetase